MKRLAGMFTLVLVAALAAPITAQDKPALPKAATEQAAPIPVAPQDVQAISQAVQTANAYALAIAALQEKLDSANSTALAGAGFRDTWSARSRQEAEPRERAGARAVWGRGTPCVLAWPAFSLWRHFFERTWQWMWSRYGR